ncbi:MAG: toll/interleukin-1 receptor domain-containing protein [Caulobacterales bacterium]|nr:toll/interleukin-1 receptor domain-containing protein [Caulobacterales bacterium]
MRRIVLLFLLETVILVGAVIAFAAGAEAVGLALLALALITPMASWLTRRPAETGAADGAESRSRSFERDPSAQKRRAPPAPDAPAPPPSPDQPGVGAPREEAADAADEAPPEAAKPAEDAGETALSGDIEEEPATGLESAADASGDEEKEEERERASVGGLAGEAAPEASEADLTVFAPSAVAPGEELLIQVFLHPPDALAKTRELASLADGQAAARPTTPMPEAIAHGASVELRVEAPGLSLDAPVQTLIWRGAPNVAYFLASAPADHAGGACFVRVRALIDGVPARTAIFRVTIATPAEGADEPAEGDGVEVGAKRYRSAFLSYAEEDRAKVMEHYQSLKAVGMEVFQDILNLEPGERWRAALFERIARCDVFLLYWSSSAAASEWVVKEAEFALQAASLDPVGRPDIIPVLLEGPPPPPPPKGLEHLHFNDPVRYIIAAHEDATS